MSEISPVEASPFCFGPVCHQLVPDAGRGGLLEIHCLNNMRQTPIEVEYAVHDGTSLKLDILLPTEARRERPAPICVWLHYGGLVQVRFPTAYVQLQNGLTIPTSREVAKVCFFRQAYFQG